MADIKADEVLAALPWRCFHCDFVTNNEAEALAHFGDRDDAEEFKPICKWWARMDEAERRETLQDTVRDLNEERNSADGLRVQVEGLEYQVDSQRGAIQSYRPFRKCISINDVFCLYDSMEGRALAAEERLAAMQTPAIAPTAICAKCAEIAP